MAAEGGAAGDAAAVAGDGEALVFDGTGLHQGAPVFDPGQRPLTADEQNCRPFSGHGLGQFREAQVITDQRGDGAQRGRQRLWMVAGAEMDIFLHGCEQPLFAVAADNAVGAGDVKGVVVAWAALFFFPFDEGAGQKDIVLAGQFAQGGEQFRGAGGKLRQSLVSKAGGPELRKGDDSRRGGSEFLQAGLDPGQIGVNRAQFDIDLQKTTEAWGRKCIWMGGQGRQEGTSL